MTGTVSETFTHVLRPGYYRDRMNASSGMSLGDAAINIWKQ